MRDGKVHSPAAAYNTAANQNILSEVQGTQCSGILITHDKAHHTAISEQIYKVCL